MFDKFFEMFTILSAKYKILYLYPSYLNFGSTYYNDLLVT